MTMTRLSFALVTAAVVAATACGKSEKSAARARLATLCVQTAETMARDSQSADTDTFQQMLVNVTQACSSACDLGDGASCTTLERHLTKVCGVSQGICANLCELTSPSIKKYTCPLVK